MAPLTPDEARFTVLALLKRTQHSRVSLLKEDDGKLRVGRCLEQPGGATEAQLLEGLDREARHLRGLRLPHVVAFDQLVEGQGGTWLLFEYVPGTLLGQYQGREASIPTDWIAHWLGCLLKALHGMHAQTPPRVIGYLEPFDIVVQQQDLTIVDIGLFERVFPELSARGLDGHPFKAFIAPERRSAVHPAASADLFSAGAVAFWLLTSRAPIVKSPASRDGMAAMLHEQRPDLSPDLERLVLDLLSFYPSARPPSAGEALERWKQLQLPGPEGRVPEAQAAEIAFAADPTKKAMQKGSDPPPRRVPPPMAMELVPTSGDPPRSAWTEFLEDVAWAGRRRPLVALLVGLLLVAPLAMRHRQPAPLSVAGPPVLMVTSGTAAMDSGQVGHHWHYSAEARPGETLLAPSAPVEAVSGTTHVWLGQSACLRVERQDGSALRLGWISGEVHLRTATDGRVGITVGTQHLEVAKDSEVWITATSIACHRGRARWLDHDLVAPQEVKR